MRLAYVIYNERPGSGLVRTQVVALLKEIKRQAPGLSVTLVCFWQPWVALRFRRELANLRAELHQSGIGLASYPWALIPSRFFLYRTVLFPILRWWGRRIFAPVLRRRYDLLHCRSYFASLIAVDLKRDHGSWIIFDIRSLWPKEHVTIGAWRETDAIHRMWVDLERRIIIGSDATIAVTSGILDEIRTIHPRANGVLIPICCDLSRFRYDPAARDALRKERGWRDRKVIVYQGSLGLMNRTIEQIAEYAAGLMALVPDAVFLLLTPATAVDVAAILEAAGVPRSQCEILEVAEGDLYRWLSAADAGIHAMAEGPDSHTRLGVKIVEYLSCGLPIVVNQHVGAAAALAKARDVGVVFDLNHPEAGAADLERLFAQGEALRARCRSLAEELFSVEQCARQYLDVYERLKTDVSAPQSPDLTARRDVADAVRR